MTKHGLILSFVLACALPAAAQPSGGRAVQALAGRHALAVQVGLLGSGSASTAVGAGLTTGAGAEGLVGSLTYTYWVRSDWAVVVLAGVLGGGATTSVGAGGVASEAAAVIPVLFGAAYYPEAWALHPALRPYLSVAAGPYTGTATRSVAGAGVSSDVVTQAVPGARLAAGVDWFPARHFKLGLAGGYHFVGAFDERIGAGTDYSGPEMSIGLGVAFGGAR